MVRTRFQEKRDNFLATENQIPVGPKRLETFLLQSLERNNQLDFENETLLEDAHWRLCINDEKVERIMKRLVNNTRKLKRIRRTVKKIIVLEKEKL